VTRRHAVRSRFPVVAIATTAIASGLCLASLLAQQRQVPGAFRGRVVLVPVDIRVLDRDGNPVTNLTQDDFTIFENDVPQRIGHFSTQAFTAAPPGVDVTPVLRSNPGLETTPVTYRTFLIVLGRGRLKEPANGMDAIIEMVRSRLLPQDQIGVLAYNRAYGLTTDRDGVLRLLESFRDRHEEIEARLDHWFSGLQLRFGSREVPPGLQAQIDALFEAAGLTGVRELAIGSYGADQFDEFRRSMVGRLIDGDLDPSDDFINPREGYDDIRNLFAGIEFLRYLEGEKHIVFLSERGLALPGKRQNESGGTFFGVEAQRQYDDFAHLAADARVTISTVQVGGIPGSWARNLGTMIPTETFLVARDNRAVANITGGMASFNKYANEAVDQLDRATRFQYLLGYYPEDTTSDGRFRSIRVAVNRPGVTTLYRQGYLSQEELVPYDRRAFMSHSRIMAAATDYRFIRDIRVTLSEPRISGGADDRSLEVDVQIDPRPLAFADVEGAKVAALHVAVFVGNRGEDLLGEQWDVLDLRLDPDSYARLQRENLAHTVRVSFTGAPRHVKVVVYDYRGDRIGTAEREIR
jgi:VWFA-related protein